RARPAGRLTRVPRGSVRGGGPVANDAATVGIVVNPLAGKDIRRLVGNASPVTDASKIGFVQRAVTGAVDGGATRILLADDPHHLATTALGRLHERFAGVDIVVLDDPLSGDRDDTVAAAVAMAKADAGAVIVFGGDGTSRDVACGWPEAPLVPVSTGTNNVFPRPWDASAAGTAAALVAAAAVDLAEVARRAKRIGVQVHATVAGELDDTALVDVALVDERFVGTRAVWHPERVRRLLAVIASPSASGLSGIAGRAHPIDRWSGGGVEVVLGDGGRLVRIQLSPGSFVEIDVDSCTPVGHGRSVVWPGPGVLALDGERTHVLHAGDSVTLTVGDGPYVIDVELALLAAARVGHFDVARPPEVRDAR